MKRMLAVSIALVVFSASVIPVFAGAAAYHSSHRRARAKADALKQETTDKWKKFRTEMDARKKVLPKTTPKTDGRQRQN